MEGKRLLISVQIKKFLSYGIESEEFELQPLNVLIGPNGSGKSNLIIAVEFLRELPKDVEAFVRKVGYHELAWKGEKHQAEFSISALVDVVIGTRDHYVEYSISVGGFDTTILIDEKITDRHGDIYESDFNSTILHERDSTSAGKVKRIASDYDRNRVISKSIISEVKDYRRFPEITGLGLVLSSIKIYQNWGLGFGSLPRQSQPADMPNDFLQEDASNLGLVLNDLLSMPEVKQQIVSRLKEFNSAYIDVGTRVYGGTVQIFLHEQGLSKPIPVTRISDGTLHYLCLLSILCHPSPPPLICIEEPEIGLHPDAISKLGELLIEASQRTQLIVTTHSDALISALSSVPESVVVCERGEEGTKLRRLDPEQLKEWLTNYSLGDLWRMGQLGGTLQ
jgi:predicted ATPase